MKRLSAAVLTLATCCGVAHAQSNVVIYGLADIGLNFSNNQGGESTHQLNSLGIQGSRLGFRGGEDLGGGLSAVFTLENGFDPSNGNLGQGGRIFGRQVFVGLDSKELGRVTLGRQYDPLVDNLAFMTANGSWGGVLFSHPFDNDNTNNSIRFNNAVKYTTSTFGGVSGSAMYAFSDQAGAFQNNRGFGVGGKYVGSGLQLGVAYLQIDNGGVSTTNPNPGGAVTETPFISGKQRIYGAGANYAVGPAILGAIWTKTMLEDVGATQRTGVDTKFNNYEVSFRYKVSEPLLLGVAYTHTTADTTGRPGVSDSKWNQVGVIADYFLSKRTDVYVQGIYQRAGGDAYVATPTGGTAARVYGLQASSNDSQSVVRVGIRHRF